MNNVDSVWTQTQRDAAVGKFIEARRIFVAVFCLTTAELNKFSELLSCGFEKYLIVVQYIIRQLLSGREDDDLYLHVSTRAKRWWTSLSSQSNKASDLRTAIKISRHVVSSLIPEIHFTLDPIRNGISAMMINVWLHNKSHVLDELVWSDEKIFVFMFTCRESDSHWDSPESCKAELRDEAGSYTQRRQPLPGDLHAGWVGSEQCYYDSNCGLWSPGHIYISYALSPTDQVHQITTIVIKTFHWVL